MPIDNSFIFNYIITLKAEKKLKNRTCEESFSLGFQLILSFARYTAIVRTRMKRRILLAVAAESCRERRKETTG